METLEGLEFMPYIDMMNISMKKEREGIYYVWYKFELSVEVGTYLSKSGKIRHMFEPRHGFVKISKKIFNKDIIDSSELIVEIIEEKTDQVFLKIDDQEKQQIIRMCLGAINQFKKGYEFPDYAAQQIG